MNYFPFFAKAQNFLSLYSITFFFGFKIHCTYVHSSCEPSESGSGVVLVVVVVVVMVVFVLVVVVLMVGMAWMGVVEDPRKVCHGIPPVSSTGMV